MGRRASECAMVYQTTLRSTSETPFSMMYKAITVILVKAGLPTSRTDVFKVGKNDQLLYKHLDLVE